MNKKVPSELVLTPSCGRKDSSPNLSLARSKAEANLSYYHLAFGIDRKNLQRQQDLNTQDTIPSWVNKTRHNW